MASRAYSATSRADILHVPHHGSRTSTHPDFIQQVQPQVGIITAGSGNPYGHPHPRVLATLAQHNVRVFRTDRHGAITITSDGTQYHIEPFIDPANPPRSVRIPPQPSCELKCVHVTFPLTVVPYLIYFWSSVTLCIGVSSNGRTPDSGSGYLGSNPSTPAVEQAPGHHNGPIV